MEVNCAKVPKAQARKRPRQPENWKANKAKRLRYTPRFLPEKICMHNNARFKCSSVNMAAMMTFYKAFYKEKCKQYQDALLLKYCKAVPIKRRRPKNNKHSKKLLTTKFYVPVGGKEVPVCQKAFLKMLNITKYRIQFIMKRHFETGEFPTEKRGGDHKTHLFVEIRKTVHEFLTSLKCTEAHYCRSSTSVRKYLPSDLNLKKLYRMYKEKYENGQHAKLGLFRKVFQTEYNLGFGTPRTDICSTCLQYQEKIRSQTDDAKKNELITHKRVHVLRAKAFYSFLKAKEDGVKTFSFDCQKNQPIPKVPDQACYYSRQLYLYNLTVVEGSSKDKLTKNNVFAYTWTEDMYAKDSNTVSSIIYHRLNNTDMTTNIHTIRLMADGCGGQNKNSFLLAMCGKWLTEHPSVKKIEVIFPITGHSYLPSDRVFGQIEKDIKRKEVVIDPETYISIISQYATIVRVGQNCPVYDWKKAAESVIKSPQQWHIKFNTCKRFFIKRSKKQGNALIEGESFYKSELGKYENICKKKKMINMIIPCEIPCGIQVKPLKIRDVNNLLTKHYGTEWHSLSELRYFNQVIPIRNQPCTETEEVQATTSTMREDEEEETYCYEHTQDSKELRV